MTLSLMLNNVMTAVGYTTNVLIDDLQSPASARCSSDCIS